MNPAHRELQDKTGDTYHRDWGSGLCRALRGPRDYCVQQEMICEHNRRHDRVDA